MNTIKFGFQKSSDKTRSFMTLTVPDRVQGGLEYKYGATLIDIKRAKSKSTIVVSQGDNTRYLFDTRLMGNAETLQRVQGAKRALALILAAQHMAQPLENNGKLIRPNMLDPAVQLRPTISKSGGNYFLGAKIAWNDASRRNAVAARIAAQERMLQVCSDLLDPKGDADDSTCLISTRINLASEIFLSVGKPPSTLETVSYNPLAPQQRFEGKVFSYEHQLVLMAGTVVLAEAAELATE